MTRQQEIAIRNFCRLGTFQLKGIRRRRSRYCAGRPTKHSKASATRSAGEWTEPPGRDLHAFHLRRRLSKREEMITGPVVDIRGTPEAEQRAAVVRRQCPQVPEALIRSELGSRGPNIFE
jgi:hypothetical protein